MFTVRHDERPHKICMQLHERTERAATAAPIASALLLLQSTEQHYRAYAIAQRVRAAPAQALDACNQPDLVPVRVSRNPPTLIFGSIAH